MSVEHLCWAINGELSRLKELLEDGWLEPDDYLKTVGPLHQALVEMSRKVNIGGIDDPSRNADSF